MGGAKENRQQAIVSIVLSIVFLKILWGGAKVVFDWAPPVAESQ